MGMTQINPDKLSGLNRLNSQTWGFQNGTFVAGLGIDSSDVAFRKNSPVSGMLSQIIDGTVFVYEGKNPVMYSVADDALSGITVPNLITKLRYGQGSTGSALISEDFTHSSVTIAKATWYNFLWVPHRFGGFYSAGSGDNHKYGTLLLFSMTSNAGIYWIRVAGEAIAYIKKIA